RRGDAAYPDSWAGTEREATTCRSSNSRVQPQGEPRARWRQPATVGGTRADIFSPLHPSAWGEGVQGRKNVLEKKNGDLTPPRLHSRPGSAASSSAAPLSSTMNSRRIPLLSRATTGRRCDCGHAW